MPFTSCDLRCTETALAFTNATRASMGFWTPNGE
jgi:hypothetical protein